MSVNSRNLSTLIFFGFERLLLEIRKAVKDILERSFQKDISMQNAKLPPHSNAKQNGIDEFGSKRLQKFRTTNERKKEGKLQRVLQ